MSGSTPLRSSTFSCTTGEVFHDCGVPQAIDANSAFVPPGMPKSTKPLRKFDVPTTCLDFPCPSWKALVKSPSRHQDQHLCKHTPKSIHYLDRAIDHLLPRYSNKSALKRSSDVTSPCGSLRSNPRNHHDRNTKVNLALTGVPTTSCRISLCRGSICSKPSKTILSHSLPFG